MRATLALLLFVFAGCDSSSSGVCQLKAPGQAMACPAGVGASSSAAACTDSTGSRYVCRNGFGYCVVCSGGTFTDGCAIEGGAQSYCVHDCSNC
jgi:hypothetical protein